MTATTADRIARVAERLYPDWIRVVTYGEPDAGAYEVFGESPTSVRWTRIGQPERAYRVRCVGGKPVGCSCPGFRYGGKCRHTTILAGLLARGQFVLPASEPAADVPDGWLHTTEVE